jgi:plastocyanin
MVTGQSFGVTFPEPGNFRLVCLVHPHMTGVIHVLETSAILPHDQAFYTEEAKRQTHALLTDTDSHHHGDDDAKDMLSVRVLSDRKSVVAGVGEMAATAAGFQSLSVVRFLNGSIQVEPGDTVEWSNLDPALPHTVTFGPDPANPGPPSANVFMDADGALHAIVTSPADNVHSGIFVAAPENQFGVPQSPPAYTRFRVTFKNAGTYNYKCALHDNLGMVGKVIVRP